MVPLAKPLTHTHSHGMPDDYPPDDTAPPRKKNMAAAELGRRGGMKGGAARAANMTQEQRSEAARLAAGARWARMRGEDGETVALTRNPDGQPFVFDLEPDEIKAITGTAISGQGGLQSLQKRLQAQLSVGKAVQFDNAGLGQLIRYMTRYPGGGGFQDRLHDAFDRSLKKLLGY